MKIVFLDVKTIGEDIDLSYFDELGEVVKYPFSTQEEALERTKDADVIVLNKVSEVTKDQLNEVKEVIANMAITDKLKVRNDAELLSYMINISPELRAKILADYIKEQQKSRQTLAIIKPDGMAHIESIIEMFYKNGLKITNFKVAIYETFTS